MAPDSGTRMWRSNSECGTSATSNPRKGVEERMPSQLEMMEQVLGSTPGPTGAGDRCARSSSISVGPSAERACFPTTPGRKSPCVREQARQDSHGTRQRQAPHQQQPQPQQQQPQQKQQQQQHPQQQQVLPPKGPKGRHSLHRASSWTKPSVAAPAPAKLSRREQEQRMAELRRESEARQARLREFRARVNYHQEIAWMQQQLMLADQARQQQQGLGEGAPPAPVGPSLELEQILEATEEEGTSGSGSGSERRQRRDRRRPQSLRGDADGPDSPSGESRASRRKRGRRKGKRRSSPPRNVPREIKWEGAGSRGEGEECSVPTHAQPQACSEQGERAVGGSEELAEEAWCADDQEADQAEQGHPAKVGEASLHPQRGRPETQHSERQPGECGRVEAGVSTAEAPSEPALVSSAETAGMPTDAGRGTSQGDGAPQEAGVPEAKATTCRGRGKGNPKTHAGGVAGLEERGAQRPGRSGNVAAPQAGKDSSPLLGLAQSLSSVPTQGRRRPPKGATVQHGVEDSRPAPAPRPLPRKKGPPALVAHSGPLPQPPSRGSMMRHPLPGFSGPLLGSKAAAAYGASSSAEPCTQPSRGRSLLQRLGSAGFSGALGLGGLSLSPWTPHCTAPDNDSIADSLPIEGLSPSSSFSSHASSPTATAKQAPGSRAKGIRTRRSAKTALSPRPLSEAAAGRRYSETNNPKGRRSNGISSPRPASIDVVAPRRSGSSKSKAISSPRPMSENVALSQRTRSRPAQRRTKSTRGSISPRPTSLDGAGGRATEAPGSRAPAGNESGRPGSDAAVEVHLDYSFAFSRARSERKPRIIAYGALIGGETAPTKVFQVNKEESPRLPPRVRQTPSASSSGSPAAALACPQAAKPASAALKSSPLLSVFGRSRSFFSGVAPNPLFEGRSMSESSEAGFPKSRGRVHLPTDALPPARRHRRSHDRPVGPAPSLASEPDSPSSSVEHSLSTRMDDLPESCHGSSRDFPPEEGRAFSGSPVGCTECGKGEECMKCEAQEKESEGSCGRSEGTSMSEPIHTGATSSSQQDPSDCGASLVSSASVGGGTP